MGFHQGFLLRFKGFTPASPTVNAHSKGLSETNLKPILKRPENQEVTKVISFFVQQSTTEKHNRTAILTLYYTSFFTEKCGVDNQRRLLLDYHISQEKDERGWVMKREREQTSRSIPHQMILYEYKDMHRQ